MLNLVPWRTPFSISPGFPHVWLGKTIGRKKEEKEIEVKGRFSTEINLYHKTRTTFELLKLANLGQKLS